MPFPDQENGPYEAGVDQLDFTAIASDAALPILWLAMKNLWLGQSHFGSSGTINEIVPGTTYELVANVRAGHVFNNPSGDFTKNGPLVGRQIEIIGATTSTNNGIFPVTSVENTSSIRFTNAAGVAEAFTGSYRVSDGNFTVRGTGSAGFSAWTCKGSGAGSTGKAYGMDGRDRWHSTSDIQLTSGDTGNHSWIVLRNTVNGTEILIDYGLTTVGRRGRAFASCENGFVSGTQTVRPTGSDEFQFMGISSLNTGYWFISEDWGLSRIQLVYITSASGTQDWMIARRNMVNQAVLGTGIAGAPETGSFIPWNGNNAYVIFPDGRNRNGVGEHLSYVEFNDDSRVLVTIDKDGSGPGPIKLLMYMTGLMFVSAMVGQQHQYAPEKLGKQWPFDRIGLAAATVGYRGRHGYIPDMAWAGDSTDQGVAQNDSFPGDGSRRWMKFGQFYLPWDGSEMRRF